MSDDTKELSYNEDRKTPAHRPFGEMSHRRCRLLVLRELLSMGVDEDVCVDRYQERPSIRS